MNWERGARKGQNGAGGKSRGQQEPRYGARGGRKIPKTSWAWMHPHRRDVTYVGAPTVSLVEGSTCGLGRGSLKWESRRRTVIVIRADLIGALGGAVDGTRGCRTPPRPDDDATQSILRARSLEPDATRTMLPPPPRAEHRGLGRPGHGAGGTASSPLLDEEPNWICARIDLPLARMGGNANVAWEALHHRLRSRTPPRNQVDVREYGRPCPRPRRGDARAAGAARTAESDRRLASAGDDAERGCARGISCNEFQQSGNRCRTGGRVDRRCKGRTGNVARCEGFLVHDVSEALEGIASGGFRMYGTPGLQDVVDDECKRRADAAIRAEARDAGLAKHDHLSLLQHAIAVPLRFPPVGQPA
ncbi:hypothetical protein DFH09DRAFT_1079784 [Mycena vulgaris]|nr:hypothetical protein DFH09DRAFT_1079784 [Mycena vulgaris]